MAKSKHRDERPRSRLDWEAVRIFAAVAEAGGVNRAAEALKLRPSSVSRRIDELETRLEVKLFHRRRSGTALTSAGEDLYERARSMQHFADDIERSVRARDQREEGLVRVASPDGVGSLWVAPRVSTFLERNPRIQLSLDCLIGPAAPDSQARADITIALDKSRAEIGDDTSTLATLHYVLAAAPTYVETYGLPASAASAAGDHRTLRQTGQISQQEVWGKRAIAVASLASFAFETNSSAAMVAALRAGAGVATVPTYLFTLAPELILIGAEPSTPIKLWLIVHREARNAARVQRVAEWLKSIFDTRAHPWFREEFVAPENFGAAQEPKKPVRRSKS